MQPDRPGPRVRSPGRWTRIGRRLGLIPPPPPPPPPEPPEVITGFVERLEGTRIGGWALSSRTLPLRFAVRADGRDESFHLQRLLRDDVRSAYPDAEPWAGFELRAAEPGTDWAAAAARGALTLLVNGQPLPFADPGSRAPERGAQEHGTEEEPSAATRAQWQALRAVNDRVEGGMHLVAAARDTIGALQLDAPATRALLHSLTPRLCVQDAAAARALLAEVPGLIPEGGRESALNAWTGGLAVLGYAREGRVREAARMLRRLADLANGPDWLPTECLHRAVRELTGSERGSRASAEQIQHFVHALLGLCQRVGGDWFSRLHDRELTAALVHALAWSLGSADPAFSRSATRAALRSHGLCPAFWELAAGLCDRSLLLAEAHGHWLTLQQAACKPGHSGSAGVSEKVESALDFMTARGNPEARWFRKELCPRESADTAGALWPSYADIARGACPGAIHPLPGPRIPETGPLLVCVVRNEHLVLPHFLAHYRALGVPHFAFIDNGSTDGTREFLAAQPDVTLFHAPGDYRDAAFGVAWQQAVLAQHGTGRWVLLVDADEFLVYPGCESTPLPAFIAERESDGADAIFTDLVDMYPPGPLDEADLGSEAPFRMAPCFDRAPLRRWHLGGGRFTSAPSFVSALRHRLAPEAEPNAFLSQKCALLRYAPWVRLGHGIHDVANVTPHPERVWLAHFKYHAAFAGKVREEIRRGQHFGAAREYRHYADILEGHRGFWTDGVSVRFEGSPSFSQHAHRAAGTPAP